MRMVRKIFSSLKRVPLLRYSIRSVLILLVLAGVAWFLRIRLEDYVARVQTVRVEQERAQLSLAVGTELQEILKEKEQFIPAIERLVPTIAEARTVEAELEGITQEHLGPTARVIIGRVIQLRDEGDVRIHEVRFTIQGSGTLVNLEDIIQALHKLPLILTIEGVSVEGARQEERKLQIEGRFFVRQQLGS